MSEDQKRNQVLPVLQFLPVLEEQERPEIDNGEDASENEPEDGEPVLIEPFDPTKIQIQMKQDSLRNLIERLRQNEIDMNTDFQRHADLWSDAKMSRLIESILIRFPLPAFYFDASNDENWLVVDGLQRLSSIRKFVVEKKLALSDLEYLKDLKGQKYDDLHRSYQRRLDECSVTLFMIMPGTPEEVKYSVFRRINTGGLVLNNQEIRNALAKPRERKYLENLAKDKNLVLAMGNQSKRMLDQELVLRFIAFFTQDYLKSKKNIAEFLDEAMKYLKSGTDMENEKLGGVFKRSIKTCYEIFGESAFEKGDGSSSRRKRKNSTLFEAWTVSIARISDQEVLALIEKNELVKEKMTKLFSNEEFFRSISLATQKRDHVKTRYEKITALIRDVVNA